MRPTAWPSSFHRKRRSKGTIRSELDQIAGTGPPPQEPDRPLRQLKRLEEVTLEELGQVEGLILGIHRDALEIDPK